MAMLQTLVSAALLPLPTSYHDSNLTTAHEMKARIRESRHGDVSVADLSMPAEDIDPLRARQIFDDHGVLVIRGLNKAHAGRILSDANSIFEQGVAMAHEGLLQEVINESNGTTAHVGWVTPDQTLFVSAPPSHVRDKQVMVLGLDYYTAASMLTAATHPPTIDVVQALLGADEIELFGKGQCFFKEGIPGLDGGNPKFLHQDSAYFMFGKGGAVATLSYTCRTDVETDNGPLYVVPGSHKLGHVAHVDTPSHLGLPSSDWAFSDGLVIEGDAGDTVFFHVHTIHGSSPNRSPRPRATFINRYIAADDYQAYFATDAAMRAKAKADYEAALERGELPKKERNLMLRGRRPWSKDGVQCALADARVNH